MTEIDESRRKFLGASAASAAGLLFMAACGSDDAAVVTDSAADTSTDSDASTGTDSSDDNTTDAAPAAEAVTLSYWYWADSPEQAALTTGPLDAFSAGSDTITVDHDNITTVADQRQKLLQSFAADAGMPDVSMASDGWLTEFTETGMLVDLDDRLAGWDTYKDWLPGVLPTAKGKPTDPQTMVTNQLLVNYLYYRQDWLDEAGVAPPDTLDDVLSVATALNDPPNRFGYGLRGGDGGGFLQQAGHYLKGNGVEIIAEDGTVDMDSDAAVETIAWWTGLFSEHGVTQPSAVTDKFPELFAALQGDKLALMHHGIWSWKIQEEALGDTISATPIPRGSERRFIDAFGEGTSIYSTSDNVDAAWEVAAFMGEEEQVRTYSLERGTAPMLGALTNEDAYGNRFYSAIMDVADDWGKFPSWHPNLTPMLSVWGPEIQRTLTGEITPKEFCTTIAEFLRTGG